jgi:hypothetical protein
MAVAVVRAVPVVLSEPSMIRSPSSRPYSYAEAQE